jgi:hypothetical protein
VRTEEDGWTVVTRDGKPSAQFEHTRDTRRRAGPDAAPRGKCADLNHRFRALERERCAYHSARDPQLSGRELRRVSRLQRLQLLVCQG